MTVHSMFCSMHLPANIVPQTPPPMMAISVSSSYTMVFHGFVPIVIRSKYKKMWFGDL